VPEAQLALPTSVATSVGFFRKIWEGFFWLVVSTHLKNISQNGNLPQVGVKINEVEGP